MKLIRIVLVAASIGLSSCASAPSPEFWEKIGKMGEAMQTAQRSIDGNLNQPLPAQPLTPLPLPAKPTTCVSHWESGSPLIPNSGVWKTVCQ
jgi:hypothetical protein